jgi:uncharacterized paraquat-inducible protein A
MALLPVFCYSITFALRRWLKTQAAAKMGATIEAMYLRRWNIIEIFVVSDKVLLFHLIYDNHGMYSSDAFETL